MKLLIVIVNYRTPALAIDCLRSIATQVPQIAGGCRVSMVDGASGDRSAELLATAIADNHWSTWCDLHVLDRNGGFAFGNNAGIRPYLESANKPEFVLLLNPDTIALPGSIVTLLDYMVEHPAIGIAGSRTEYPDGSPQTSAFRFPGIASEFEGGVKLGVVSKILKRYIVAPPPPDQESDADWVVGASMIIRRDVFEAIGLMDERYFMYFEEVDFCLRARRSGFKCRYVPASHIVHLIGQSSGVTDRAKQNRRRPAYWFDSRRRYFTKNYGLIYAALADVAFAIGFSLWRIRRAIQRKPDPDPAHLLSDFIRHSVFAKGRAA